mmetsp:Transcript_25598/g.76865  ORF Transcript_25598/g.76865 Transcript_25598/m.76865 type:complete len:427 (-) Transcript_25598:44-1324(-)
MQTTYEEKTGKSLFKMIRGESWSMWSLLDDGLSDFSRICTWRMMADDRQTAYFLQRKTEGFFADDKAICEILSTRSNAELKAAAAVYEEDTKKSLAEMLNKKTSGVMTKGNYGKWIEELTKFECEEGFEPAAGQLEDEADQLYKACEGRSLTTDAGPFIEILAKASPEHVEALKAAYEAHPKTKRSLMKTLEKGFSGNMETALLAKCTPRFEYLAYRLHVATKVDQMVDTGTDEEIICRILASLSKIEIIEQLLPKYDEMYAAKDKMDFQAMMKSEISGDFLRAVQDITTTLPPCGHLLEPERASYEACADETKANAYAGLEATYDYEKAAELGARVPTLLEKTAWDVPVPAATIDLTLVNHDDAATGVARDWMGNYAVDESTAVPNELYDAVLQGPEVPIANLIERATPYTIESDWYREQYAAGG